MKEIQSPELLKPCCDKGDGGDTRQKDGWHCLPVLLQGASTAVQGAVLEARCI